jgi:DNA-binding GntR family transcriptional regulator
MILNGELKPDQPVSQLAIGRKLGVSATPVREAIRLLSAEGLLVSEHNQRARVAPLNVQDLEAIYSARVTGEAVGIAMTVRSLRPEQLKALDESLASLHAAAEQDDLEVWTEVHARFHKQLIGGANPFQAELLASLFDRSERYRRLSVLESNPRTWAAANAEHEEIVLACHRRDAAAAARLLANHLGRTALTLTASFAPDVNATAVRTAVSIVDAWQGW